MAGKYTDITEVTEKPLHTLIEKAAVHEKEAIDGEIMMRIDIYHRFIGNVGSGSGEALKVPNIRWSNRLLAASA